MPPLHHQLERVLVRRARLLRAVARRACGCPEDAADAVQRAAEIALTKAPLMDDEAMAAWLVVVARREAWRIARGRRLAPTAEAEERTEPGSDPAEQVLLRRASRERLARLRPEERLALMLKSAGFSYREIAERSGWSERKVERALVGARARIRETSP